ncbi:AAA family ATPase [Allopontixanthobacter confluentis]|uniref:AAA family ATPase n=1 Tax=Allopontixanthobacter confluentis TaxID=1849021 RepID=UPI00136EE3C2
MLSLSPESRHLDCLLGRLKREGIVLVELKRPPKRLRDAPIALDKLTIGAFRNLENVELEDLGRINLLVGVNNAGKTSILEAIAVLQNPFSPYEWFNAVRTRETRSVGYMPDQMSVLEAIRWMFPISNDPMEIENQISPITLSSEAHGRSDDLRITCEEINGFIDPETFSKAFAGVRKRDAVEPVEDSGLLIRASAHISQGLLSPEYFEQEWVLWSQLGLRTEMGARRPTGNLQFLAPYAHRNSPANLRLLSEASKFGGRDDIDALLRDLDPRISGVEIITSDDGRYPKIAIRMRDGALMPQGIFGDGVRRALSIALAIRKCANGILLIDEIEAALHVSALDRVYRWLDQAANSYNVQIFATTHSLEAIEAVISSVAPNSHSDLSGYALGDAKEGGVKRYTGGMLHRLVRQRGLDIRY